MSDIMNLFLSTLSKFIGDGLFVIFAAICLLIMMFEKGKRHCYAVPILILVMVVLNPFVIIYLNQSVLQEERISKIYMILPIFMLISYVVAKYCKKWYSLLIVVIIIIVTGQFMITRDVYDYSKNPYKLETKVIEVCDFIEQDMDNGNEEVVVLAEQDLVDQIRQYNPRFILTLNRYSYWQPEESADLLVNQMRSGEINVKVFCENAEKNNVDYIVISHERMMDDDMSKYGYDLINNIWGYCIYVKRK